MAAMSLFPFGVLIVFLVITGSVWIIANVNNNMMAMPQ
jgi:heme/copper-type cytochrome/quinol oxidase subunit 4